LQAQARANVSKARELLQAGYNRLKTAYDKLPRTAIDPDNEELKATRAKVEASYLRAELDLAICTYEESRTWDNQSDAYRSILTRAAGEFENLHEKYRTQLVGLHARMWQGKCYEEQGDVSKALGIYSELLNHPGRSDVMQQLQDRVRQFRLICLNHEQNKEYELVTQEASLWLVESKNRRTSPVGLGIRWERARALEQLGRKSDLPEHLREQRLKEALDDAREINRHEGEYKDASSAMIARLNMALNRTTGNPKSFDEAIGLSRKNINDIGQFNEQIASAADADEKKRLQDNLKRHLEETERLLFLGLELAQPSTERKNVQNARYILAFVNYELGNSYKAAILAEYAARHLKMDDPALAAEAAYLAFASWQQAYFNASEEDRKTDLKYLFRAAESLIQDWPDGERAAEACTALGRIYDRLKQPLEAASWYQRVPDTSDYYVKAQLAAGQSNWTAWLNVAALPGESKPAPDTLDNWKHSAEQLLRTGIRAATENSEADEIARELTAGKVSLAQILVSKGEYDEAISLLTDRPSAPVEAIKVADESSRSDEGITGRPFAGLVYQLLLRAYVGAQRIDEALAAMEGLENIAGGAGGERVAAVYISLGREIQQEIERLVDQQDDTRLAEVRASFDQFLESIFQRKAGMSYGSLIWIAETYYGMGSGLNENQQVARGYFRKASATYDEILRRDHADDAFVPDDREPGVRLRQVDCLKREGQFEQAFELIQVVLKDLPRALDAQFEAAAILQEWGAEDPEKYLLAINGTVADDPSANEEDGYVWGWAQTSTRLQRILASGSTSEEYRTKFTLTRYHIAECRRRYALSRSSSTERNATLAKALQEIEAYVLVASSVDDDSWTKLDTLYRQIQKDIGRLPKPLARPSVQVTSAKSDSETSVVPDRKENLQTVTAAPSKRSASSKSERSSGSLLLFAIVGFLIAGGAVVVFVVLTSRPSRKLPIADVEQLKLPVGATASSSKPGRRSAALSSRTRAQAGKALRKKNS
jgi:cellulose synthase operon protein C